MSKLAQLIALEEGIDVPGSAVNRDNNPGALHHSPHSFHLPGDPNGVGHIPKIALGWEDLERQLQLFADRHLTLRHAIYLYAPPAENNTAAYLNYIRSGLGVRSGIPVARALAIPNAPPPPLEVLP